MMTMARQDARRIAAAVADIFSAPLPVDDEPEFIEYARSMKERHTAAIEGALVNGTEDTCIVAYKNGAPVMLSMVLHRGPDGSWLLLGRSLA
jgi:hypothetical protein